MEFQYSDILEPSMYQTGGLSGDIPLRRHKTPFKEDIGAIRAQEDWSRLITPMKGYKGGLSRKYGLMQVGVPECRPERLEVISYANELAFLYDDCTELFNQEELDHANDSMQSAFGEGMKSGRIESKAGGLKAMQSILLEEMKAIDEHRAMTAMKVWVEFLQEAAGRQHDADHSTLASYIPYRMLDVGEMFWFGLVTFGMALTIPDSEMKLVRELTRPCWVVLALQNDVLSYDKELEASKRKGASHVVNGLWIIMKEQMVDLSQATELCKREIETNIVEYQRVVEENRHNESISRDSRVYMEALLYTISGNGVWSLVAPRYNPRLTYNDLQLSMMENGLEAALSKLASDDETSVVHKSGLNGGSMSVLGSEALAFRKYTMSA